VLAGRFYITNKSVEGVAACLISCNADGLGVINRLYSLLSAEELDLASQYRFVQETTIAIFVAIAHAREIVRLDADKRRL
jgi:hypothetical protein